MLKKKSQKQEIELLKKQIQILQAKQFAKQFANVAAYVC